eukprot:SAG11_NODE_4784_length_1767_cov_1.585731_2_plen_137_part_00
MRTRLARLSQDLADVQGESHAAEQTELQRMRLEFDRESKETAAALKKHRIAETKQFETEALLHSQNRLLTKAEGRARMLQDEMEMLEESMQFAATGVVEAKGNAEIVRRVALLHPLGSQISIHAFLIHATCCCLRS